MVSVQSSNNYLFHKVLFHYSLNPQGSQNAGICFKSSDLLPDEKKSFEVPDRFKRVVRTTDKNVSFPTTPALLMLIFCRNVLQG